MSFKKLILVGAVVGVGIFAIRGTKFFGHAKHEVSSLVDWVESNIPPEKEIARLRKEVSALDKDIRDVGSALAKETVEVKYLRKDAGKLKTQVVKEEENINARGQTISDATEKVSFGGRMISMNDAKEMLNAEVTRQLGRKKALKAMEMSLTARENVKVTLENQLDELKKKKIELSAEIDTVEADINVVKLHQMQSKYSFDSSRLSRIKESLQELKKNNDVAKEMLKLEPSIREEGTSSVEKMTVSDILDRLNEDKADSGKVTKN